MAEKNGNGKPKKLKVLMVSNYALASDLAWQLVKEGHVVKFYIGDKASKDTADGFVDKVDDWKEHSAWADLIIFDDCLGFGKEAEKLRKEGKFVVGGTAYSDRLEDDRQFGQDEMQSVGITVLPHWDFMGDRNFDDAIKFVKENPGRYVLKPCGKIANEKELLFVGAEEDGMDMLQVMEHYKKNWSKKMKFFQLQKYAKGVEIAIGAFFNGKKFITPINVNFEHKKLFPGEKGPSTGEMGTSMYWCEPNKIFKTTLEKMTAKLAETGYVGYIDINCIVNGNGIHPLEFTCRFGYPTISIHMEGIDSPMGEFLYAIARGEDYNLKVKSGFQIGVVIAVPPFPFEDDVNTYKKFSEDATILFKKPNKDGVHIAYVKLVDDDWLVTGGCGYVLVVTGSGPTMREAQAVAYKRVENIMIPNMFFRTDIGDRWENDSDLLQTWGLLP
jgi:phosphoribosylamine--glycine ligase